MERTHSRQFFLSLTMVVLSFISSCGDTIDCSGCSEDEICWYSTDYDGSLDGNGCFPWPAACESDRTCECVNSQTESNEACWTVGVQNSGACSLDENGEPLLSCETTLG